MKLTVVSVSNAVLNELVYIYREIKNISNEALDLKLHYVGKKVKEEKIQQIIEDIVDADMTLIDLMGATRRVWTEIAEACKISKGDIVPIGDRSKDIQSCMKLGNFSAKSMKMMNKNNEKSMKPENMMKMMNMAEKIGKTIPTGKFKDMKNLSYINKYWSNGTEYDIRNLIYLILRDYGGIKSFPKPEPPRELLDRAICHPLEMKYYKDYKEYAEKYGYDESKPNIAVLFYGHNYPTKSSDAVGKIVDRISEFANVIPIASTTVSDRSHEELKRFLFEASGKKVSLIINFMSFRMGAGPMGGDVDRSLKMLSELKAPIIHPFFMTRRKVEEWQESEQGINSSEFLVSVMMPELDGAIEMFPVGAMIKKEKSVECNLELVELDLIEERVDKLIGKIKAWLNLRNKCNNKKKIAIIGYNYPPGEGNLFGGAFLDTFKSIENILKELKEKGYNTEKLSSEELMNKFFDDSIVNSGRWTNDSHLSNVIKYSSNNYEDYISSKKWKNELIEQWGTSPGEIMSKEKDFYIPGIINKNIFIGLQPSRGIHENPEKAYHDKSLLPHHQYIAFYKWLKEEFKADAVIHIGTHGTLEFLKGKECGMSGECFPDILLWDIPHIYLYYCGNPSEAMIAKRRSHAAIVTYQSPVFVEGELYGEYAKLEALINEYYEAARANPKRCIYIKEEIIEKAKENNLIFDDFNDIENELYRMKRSLIPKGLHIFGQNYNKEELLNYMKFVLRYDRGDVKSLRRIQAEKEEIDYDSVLEKNDTCNLKKLDKKVEEIISKYLKFKNLKDINVKNKDYIKQMEKSLKFGLDVYERSSRCFEKEGLIKALSGEYVEAKLAGDVIRNPEVLPSGFNCYQFDPRFVPSESAVESGRKIAKNTINQYLNQHDEYPRSTAIVLWGLETSRTQGETVGQILSYLGVKVNSKKNDFKLKYEIMSLEELGRPRIDTVVNICGFFRDMFPNLMEDLNQIFNIIANLDEPDEMNYVKNNKIRLYEQLLSEGYSCEEAEELACARLFGPAEGEYGTKVTSLIETKNWESENDIGDTFVKSLNHVYTENYRGKSMKNLFNKNLSVVDIVSQIRSNHEYEVTDLDHYYEFFGGLAKSVEIAKGKKSEIYITDTTGEKIQTENVEKSINRGIRTRILNPRWIDGMLEHKYHGVQKMSDIFENILGLSATTNKVEQWVYHDLYDKYVNDDELRERLIDNNKWAYFNILETMIELKQRKYWDATEQEIENIKKHYIELEGDIEEGI